MNQRTIKVLSPVASTVAKRAPISARLSEFKGKTAGILWNGKPNGDILLGRIRDLLQERLKLAGHLWSQKTRFDLADAAAIKALASSSDFVVVGPGD